MSLERKIESSIFLCIPRDLNILGKSCTTFVIVKIVRNLSRGRNPCQRVNHVKSGVIYFSAFIFSYDTIHVSGTIHTWNRGLTVSTRRYARNAPVLPPRTRKQKFRVRSTSSSDSFWGKQPLFSLWVVVRSFLKSPPDFIRHLFPLYPPQDSNNNLLFRILRLLNQVLRLLAASSLISMPNSGMLWPRRLLSKNGFFTQRTLVLLASLSS